MVVRERGRKRRKEREREKEEEGGRERGREGGGRGRERERERERERNLMEVENMLLYCQISSVSFPGPIPSFTIGKKMGNGACEQG